MSLDKDWDVEKYREDHESEEQWELRRTFLETWKDAYPEDRLLCLAQVFINMEFLGCRYPTKLMKQVSSMSEKLVMPYREAKKHRLKRTFVSASDAAEDRAKGIKRQCGIVVEAKGQIPISFVKESNVLEEAISSDNSDKEEVKEKNPYKPSKSYSDVKDNNYLSDMLSVKCVSVKKFEPAMFETKYGKMVMFVRPWMPVMQNIFSMCDTCNLRKQEIHECGSTSFYINNILVAQAKGNTKTEIKRALETLVWTKLREECIVVIVKENIVSEGRSITNDDVTGKSGKDVFGTPVDNAVAVKMMKLMGWKGGGLGSEQQGIAEPINPNLQLVRRAGLGSTTTDKRQLRSTAKNLMMRFKRSDSFDVDLVFAADFTKEEREVLHNVARICDLVSKSYGKDSDRFLVVRKRRLDPFSLTCQIVERGGVTSKYHVFIPEKICL